MRLGLCGDLIVSRYPGLDSVCVMIPQVFDSMDDCDFLFFFKKKKDGNFYNSGDIS